MTLMEQATGLQHCHHALPHMRRMFPIVWSSRCSVNFAALATLVSFSTAILQRQMQTPCTMRALQQRPLPVVPSLTHPFTVQRSLLDALRHHKALIAVGRICHGACPAALVRPESSRTSVQMLLPSGLGRTVAQLPPLRPQCPPKASYGRCMQCARQTFTQACVSVFQFFSALCTRLSTWDAASVRGRHA
jgi:hypothetical protein